MRIISGKWKGKRLNAPKNIPTRPTTDFAKEGLFNVLNHRFYFDEIEVLDLFSGIGGISLEFASRGVKKVISVDNNRVCAKFIDETSKKLELNQVFVLKEDVFKFINKPSSNYDIIFADPPFDLDIEKYEDLINTIVTESWLSEDGIFILEHNKKLDFSSHSYYQETKKYSNIHFSFFTTTKN